MNQPESHESPPASQASEANDSKGGPTQTEESSSKRSGSAEKGNMAPEGGRGSRIFTFLKRWTLRLGIATPIVILLLWIGVHRYPWLGSWLADSLRSVVGVKAVTELENTAYSMQDAWNRFWRSNDKPKAHWEVPTTPRRSAKPPIVDAGPPPLSSFRPADVGPVHKSWSAPGDGVWVPIVDPRKANDDPYMFKTLLHPDRNRSWAESFVVAIDLRRVDLHSVAGYREPKATMTAGRAYKRTAIIPGDHLEPLLAAFNGGFKLEHGHYGMKVDGVTLVRPRKYACTVTLYKSGNLKIGAWKNLADTEDRMVWWRQAPGCMYENGKMHPGLHSEDNTAWGATLDGKTVIRRSAIGLSEDARILYVTVTNDTTAQALAKGMRHAGAFSVAQLDVNWSYPKFVLYEPGDAGSLMAFPLAKGFEFSEDEFIRKKSLRDFFYLTVKKERDFIRDAPRAEPTGDPLDAGADAGDADGDAKNNPTP